MIDADKKERTYISNVFIYPLCYEIPSDFDAQRDFGKKLVTWSHSYLLSAL